MEFSSFEILIIIIVITIVIVITKSEIKKNKITDKKNNHIQQTTFDIVYKSSEDIRNKNNDIEKIDFNNADEKDFKENIINNIKNPKKSYMETTVSGLIKHKLKNGNISYQKEVSHKGLNKFRVVKASSWYELDLKVESLKEQWDSQWEKSYERECRKKNIEDAYSYAEELSEEAFYIQEELDNILLGHLHISKLRPSDLKDLSEYSEPKPEYPQLESKPSKPNRIEVKYNPKPSFFTRLSKKKMEELKKSNDLKFEEDLKEYNIKNNAVYSRNKLKIEEYYKKCEEWNIREAEFKKNQEEHNNEIDLFFKNYKAGKKEAVEQYFIMLLEKLELPFEYGKSTEIEYNPDEKMMIIDMFLPIIDDIPNLKSVSYIKTRNEFKETYYAESYIKNKYDSVIYQMVLQTLNYIFSIAKDDLIDFIVFNGKISTIDKSTGKNIEPYILSVSIKRNDFNEINLKAVDPKTWFKSAKGVSAASLAKVAPVAPLITMSKEDKRFVEGYSVSENIDEGFNLASMDWQDFENLVREIFEKEFNVNGGEVKITQASRDGGVDAVAFDPDPIRGGKIVIQAKRYTNVVGVSAVRDLYGTVMNEGANKGILVTTSNYGNDAYDFAKGKPITLMNGANLLYLLEKHGYKAKIDLHKK
ncbi:restriction endonuclease [Brachyspira intermedia]|uniref:restriction endonuclease n=1 Tax=Brachyspira intermedia TaxID=84377 RepID=UPI0030047C88